MSFTRAALFALGLAACSGPTRTEPTTQSHPTGELPVESIPAPGDGGGGAVPEPPPESTTPAEHPGASRRAEPRDIAQAPVDAGVGRDAGGRDAGAFRDAGTGFGDAGAGGRDGGIVVGGDAGVGGPR